MICKLLNSLPETRVRRLRGRSTCRRRSCFGWPRFRPLADTVWRARPNRPRRRWRAAHTIGRKCRKTALGWCPAVQPRTRARPRRRAWPTVAAPRHCATGCVSQRPSRSPSAPVGARRCARARSRTKAYCMAGCPHLKVLRPRLPSKKDQKKKQRLSVLPRIIRLTVMLPNLTLNWSRY